jgi:hypothetical protein
MEEVSDGDEGGHGGVHARRSRKEAGMGNGGGTLKKKKSRLWLLSNFCRCCEISCHSGVTNGGRNDNDSSVLLWFPSRLFSPTTRISDQVLLCGVNLI